MPIRGLLRLALGLLLAAASSVASAAPETWILIDTAVHRLDIYRGYTPLKRFRNIALGSGGPAPLHLAGDATTPLGEFRITHINRRSRFHIFLGLDYPTMAHLERAREEGLIDAISHEAYLDTMRVNNHPPQNTLLGGSIGIHGIGDGDPAIHARYNWTQGCIALTNEQIEQIARFVRVGTRVFVR